MKTLLNESNLVYIFLAFFSATLFVACDCDGPSDVGKISMIKVEDLPPEVTPGPEPQFKIKIKIDFNVDINATTLSAPGSINISAKGTSGNEDKLIQGTVQYVASTRSAYFISTNSLGFSPGPGENVTYTIQVMGVGSNCVKRTTGECIDGCDDDTDPGDNHVRKIVVIG